MSAIIHCGLCQRPVQPKRQISWVFVALCLITAGIWLITYPFKSKSYCPFCKSKIR